MGHPLIGVTTYGRDEKNHFTLPAEYVDALRRAGAIPVLLPPGESEFQRWMEIIDGLILAGGGDIDPELYGGQPHETVYMVDAERDGFEIEVTRAILESGLPTLCICRGTQILNVALGGTLHEHLPDAYGESIRHRLPPREPTLHRVSVGADSKLAGILGETEFSSASWHHQALKETGTGLEVVGRAPDGVVEALELPEHPWLHAVQWHPELTAHEDPVQQRLFAALVKASIELRRS